MFNAACKPGRISATTFLNSVGVNNLFLFFPGRSIIYEECGHGKRALITCKLSVVLWKQISAKRIIEL